MLRVCEISLSAFLKATKGVNSAFSQWHEIDQNSISAFAEATKDHQFIHVDPARAALTPFGGPIAHGFLPLSLLSALLEDGIGAINGVEMSMNYGFDKIRFLKPVCAGQSIRARFFLKDVEARSLGQTKLHIAVTVEIKNEEKPALIAEWLVLLIAK